MKTKRLPPQPTDTALARLVHRLVDRLPLVTVLEHRRVNMRLLVAKKEVEIRRIQSITDGQHIEALYRDIMQLERSVKFPIPVVDRVFVEDRHDEFGDARIVSVKYRDFAYCSGFPDLGRKFINPVQVSEWGRLALRDAANAIAQEAAKQHAQYIINATLKQGDFKL